MTRFFTREYTKTFQTICAALVLFMLCLCLIFSENVFSFFGAAFCHQFPSRSPEAHGLIFPFCYRCSGLFLGILFSSLFILLTKRSPKLLDPYAIVFFCLALIFFVTDVINSSGFLKATLYTGSQELRMISGFSLGAVIPLFVMPALSTVFTDVSNRFRRMKASALLHFLYCAVFCYFCVLGISQNNTVLFYLFAALCSVSAFGFLAVLYSILIRIILVYRYDIESSVNIIYAGMLCALVQIIVFSSLHHILLNAIL